MQTYINQCRFSGRIISIETFKTTNETPMEIISLQCSEEIIKFLFFDWRSETANINQLVEIVARFDRTSFKDQLDRKKYTYDFITVHFATEDAEYFSTFNGLVQSFSAIPFGSIRKH